MKLNVFLKPFLLACPGFLPYNSHQGEVPREDATKAINIIDKYQIE